jgi:hypothetical protein
MTAEEGEITTINTEHVNKALKAISETTLHFTNWKRSDFE